MKRKKIFTVTLCVLFCAFIIAGGVLYLLLPEKEYSPKEKRYLSGAPAVTAANVFSGKFSSDFESFLADQTPFRTFFVSVNAYFELLRGNNGSGGVYLGKDGVLIEKPFDTKNIFDINKKEIIDFASEVNVPVSLVAVPEKGAVLGEYLPGNALKYEDFSYIAELDEECGKAENITFVNLTAAFSGGGKENYYYKTDHHWTSDGAFAAYGQICRSLGFPSRIEADYRIITSPGFYGTSYSKSCYTLTKPDTVKLYESKTGMRAAVRITEGSKTETHKGVFFKENLKDDDQYTAFLDGNHTRVDIKAGAGGKKLLVIKDSFAHCLVPFLADNYSEITMIDLRYFRQSVKALAEEEGFDEVMFIYGVDSLAESRDIIL